MKPKWYQFSPGFLDAFVPPMIIAVLVTTMISIIIYHGVDLGTR